MNGTSVIIPAWNAADTLEECLVSVFAQTRAPSQIIVVDDGSTDGTPHLDILRRDSVLLIRQENRGAAAAMNSGLDAATGRFVAFIDADDLWTPGKLGAQEDALNANPDLSGIFGHVEAFPCPTSSEEERSRWDMDAASGPGWLAGAGLFRREAFAHERFDASLPTGYFIDLLARLREAGERFAMDDGVVLRRRLHAGSLSQRRAAMADGFLMMAKRALERRRKRDADE